MGHLLFYTADAAKGQAIRDLCRRLELSAEEIGPSDLNRTIGEITAMPVIRKIKGQQHLTAPAFFCMPDMILFAGITDGQMDAFLDGYREAKIDPTPVKAAVTPFNVSWTLYELILAILREREELSKGGKL